MTATTATQKNTKAEVSKKISSYLNKTSTHLFVLPNGELYKIIPFECNNEKYYAQLWFGKGEPRVNIQPQLADWLYNHVPTQAYEYTKRRCFSPEVKHKSIPNFKAAKALIQKVKDALGTYNGSAPELVVKTQIVEILKEAGEFKKPESKTEE